jgi:uncharacterized C2H2 Zn-finger protein
MKIKRALLLCAKCRKWSGWISRTKGGVKRIDTRCSPCGARLRGTPDYWRDVNRQYRNAYRTGRGAHNRSESIARLIPVENHVPVKRLAGAYNTKRVPDPIGGIENDFFVKASMLVHQANQRNGP